MVWPARGCNSCKHTKNDLLMWGRGQNSRSFTLVSYSVSVLWSFWDLSSWFSRFSIALVLSVLSVLCSPSYWVSLSSWYLGSQFSRFWGSHIFSFSFFSSWFSSTLAHLVLLFLSENYLQFLAFLVVDSLKFQFFDLVAPSLCPAGSSLFPSFY